MIIGETLMSSDNSTVKTYFGPWMAAEGNLAVVACEVVNTTNLQSFTVTVQTKNSEQSDKDAANPAGGASNVITLSTETLTKFNVGAKLSDTVNDGFKELYRYKYSVTGALAIGAGNGYVHFRMLNPSWVTH